MQQDLQYHRVKSLKFSVLGQKETERQAKVVVKNRQPRSSAQGSQAVHQNITATIHDSHLGTMSHSVRCGTCNHTKEKCQGHNGMIDVKHPYVLQQFEQFVMTALKKICINETADRKMCMKLIGDAAKCPYCKQDPYKLVSKAITGYTVTFKKGKGAGENQKTLTIAEIEKIFASVDVEQAKRVLGCEKGLAEFIVTSFPVPSQINRPERRVSSKGQDELTTSLSAIVDTAMTLRSMTVQDPGFDNIYTHFIRSVKNYQIGDKSEEGDQKAKSLTTSLCGKEGSIRFGMLGKRVNNIGRAVTACDASNTPDEATLPIEFVQTVFVKETLRDYNYERLMKAFNNGPSVYPGASAIQRQDGKMLRIQDSSSRPGRANAKEVSFNFGDTLYRHLQAGDRVIICRQPSLLSNSLGSHKIKVAQDSTKDTIDINTLAVSQYNADFDGDELNSIFLQNWQSIAEATFISAIHTRLIQDVNGKMLVGQMQDSVVGGYMITRPDVRVDDMFLVRIHSNANTRFNMFKYSDQGPVVSGSQGLSVIMPEVSFKGKSEFCKNSALQKRIQFADNEKNIDIQLGEIKSGFFDKGASEVQIMIALMQEPKNAMDTIFSIQQAILNYNKYAGFSIGLRDILLSQQSVEQIQNKNDDMMRKSAILIDQYAKNLLSEPVGKSRWEFLQDRVKDTFNDEGIDAMMASFGTDERGYPADVSSGVANALATMAITGSKGSFGNIKLMIIRLGQALNDNKPLPYIFDYRLNAFHRKNDLDPRAQGVIMNSYLQGLSPSELLANCIPERTQMLNKVLTVAKPGYMGRKMIKNLEPLMVNNVRLCRKERSITELLYAHDGFQVQSLGKYTIPAFAESREEFIGQMMSSDLFKNNSKLGVICKEHAKYVANQVHEFKLISMALQKVNSSHSVHGTLQIPVMLEGIVRNGELQAAIDTKQINEQTLIQMFTDNAGLLNDFIAKLGSLYFNSGFQKREETAVPAYYQAAMNAVKLGLLCCFGVERLMRFTTPQLVLVLEKIALEIKNGMVEPGMPIGVRVGQAMQEYFTQDMLDSIHKTASGQVTRDPLDRATDIFNNKVPEKLHADGKMLPFMRIPLIPGFEGASVKQQRERAEQIASNIKLIKLNTIANKWQMMSGLVEREADASHIEDQDFLQALPQNASEWCLRVSLDKMKMFLNRISVAEIKYALERHPDLDVLVQTSSEGHKAPVIRIYFLNTITFTKRGDMRRIVERLLDSPVRGVTNILSAAVIEENRQIMDSNGKLSQTPHIYILAEGYNMRDIYRLQHKYQDIDYNSITTDNQYQCMQQFGLQAARQKIINELNILFQSKVSQRHVEFLAAEMTVIGTLTNVEQNGIRARNPHNELLAMSDQRPVSTLRKAAIQGKKSSLEGCSASFIAGQCPSFGTTYNTLIVNEEFLAEQALQMKTFIDSV